MSKINKYELMRGLKVLVDDKGLFFLLFLIPQMWPTMFLSEYILNLLHNKFWKEKKGFVVMWNSLPHELSNRLSCANLVVPFLCPWKRETREKCQFLALLSLAWIIQWWGKIIWHTDYGAWLKLAKLIRIRDDYPVIGLG